MDIIDNVPVWARHRNGLSTKYVGPVAWVVLHGLYNSLCKGGHLNKPKNRQLLLDILDKLGRAFPCIYCRRSIPGFVEKLSEAFMQPVPDTSRNLMRDLHNRVNKKLYDQAHDANEIVRTKAIDSGSLLKTPNYGIVIDHRVEDIGWEVYAKHFLLYCAARIHSSDQKGADGKPEGDRRPDLIAMFKLLNEAMDVLKRPPIRIPTSDDDLCFPLDSAHPGKSARMLLNLVKAFAD
jgi:hypothetical protein